MPRTITVVSADGPEWTMAPARFAAAATALRGFAKIPVKVTCTPRSDRMTPAFNASRRDRSAEIISSALS